MPSTQFLDAVISASSDQAFLTLLTFTHTNLPSPIRVTNNTQDVTSGGQTFLAFPFTLTPPSNGEGAGQSAGITVANADRRIAQAIESLLDPVSVAVAIVLASSPNTIEFEFKYLSLVDVQWTADVLRGSLVREQYTREMYPYHRVTPGRFPSLYR